MIDWTRVDDLRMEIDRDSFDEILLSFLDESAQALARLAQTDPAQQAEARHFLKGTALALGFNDLAQACDRREPADRLFILFAESRRLFLHGLTERGLDPAPIHAAGQISTSVST